ncbi:MAG: hypothetical protein ACXAC8_04235 [Candidatus Hodarchaeales archaeon]
MKDPTVLAQTIYERAFARLKRKQAHSHQILHESFKTLARPSSEEIQSE